MEENLKEVITSSEFSLLPLQAVVKLTKCFDLEIKELDLFIAIVQWSKSRKEALSAEDKKLAFKHIRYPLIRKVDLANKVLPTQLADPDLYKAALDYHDTDKNNGPANKIRIREYYFDFDCSIHSGIHVNHTAKGTLLTKTSIHARKTRNMAPVYPKEGQPITLSCASSHAPTKARQGSGWLMRMLRMKKLLTVKTLITFH